MKIEQSNKEIIDLTEYSKRRGEEVPANVHNPRTRCKMHRDRERNFRGNVVNLLRDTSFRQYLIYASDIETPRGCIHSQSIFDK